MTDLTQKKCVPCEGGVAPLAGDPLRHYQDQIDPSWMVREGRKLFRAFTFKDFPQAMQFVDSIADIAEAEGHHPDISIFYNRVELQLWTHAIGGLSENDFILAAKVDQLPMRKSASS